MSHSSTPRGANDNPASSAACQIRGAHPRALDPAGEPLDALARVRIERDRAVEIEVGRVTAAGGEERQPAMNQGVDTVRPMPEIRIKVDEGAGEIAQLLIDEGAREQRPDQVVVQSQRQPIALA